MNGSVVHATGEAWNGNSLKQQLRQPGPLTPPLSPPPSGDSPSGDSPSGDSAPEPIGVTFVVFSSSDDQPLAYEVDPSVKKVRAILSALGHEYARTSLTLSLEIARLAASSLDAQDPVQALVRSVLLQLPIITEYRGHESPKDVLKSLLPSPPPSVSADSADTSIPHSPLAPNVELAAAFLPLQELILQTVLHRTKSFPAIDVLESEQFNALASRCSAAATKAVNVNWLACSLSRLAMQLRRLRDEFNTRFIHNLALKGYLMLDRSCNDLASFILCERILLDTTIDVAVISARGEEQFEFFAAAMDCAARLPSVLRQIGAFSVVTARLRCAPSRESYSKALSLLDSKIPVVAYADLLLEVGLADKSFRVHQARPRGSRKGMSSMASMVAQLVVSHEIESISDSDDDEDQPSSQVHPVDDSQDVTDQPPEAPNTYIKQAMSLYRKLASSDTLPTTQLDARLAFAHAVMRVEALCDLPEQTARINRKHAIDWLVGAPWSTPKGGSLLCGERGHRLAVGAVQLLRTVTGLKLDAFPGPIQQMLKRAPASCAPSV